MQVTDRLYTTEEFRAFENLPENANKNFELINGVIVEVPSSSPYRGMVSSQMGFHIWYYLHQNEIGYAFPSIDCEIAPGFIPVPTICYFSHERLPKIPERLISAPDLAVETLSPTNTLANVTEKIKGYLAYGTQAVWVIDTEAKTVTVYEQTESGHIVRQLITADESVDGGAVLPGFSVKVNDIFPDIEEEK